MARLHGQNFRILLWDSDNEAFKCIGMSTGCTVTLTNNVEEATTKDDVGLASKPVTTSKTWSVQVDSLSVLDVGGLLSVMKNMTKVDLLWDETDTTDNQAPEKNAFSRGGSAYLSDGTFTFDNRTNSAKKLQFVGCSALAYDADYPSVDYSPDDSYTKGQFVRLFLSSNSSAAANSVIGAARSLSLHCSLSLEDATTKDTDGEWVVQEPTALSYDISTGALVRSGETITSQVGAKSLSDLETIYDAGTPVKWAIANVNGDNNRTKVGSAIVSGLATLTTLTINGPNRQVADYTAQMQGYGDFTVGS